MSRKLRWSRVLAQGSMGLLLGALCGCSQSPVGGEQAASQDRPAGAASPASASSDNPGIDFPCTVARIRRAPAPFHWSYKKIVPPLTDADWEAEVTANSIIGTIVDSSGTRAIRGTRSDSTEWNTAVTLLTAPLPASTFALVNNSSAVARVGTEKMNGEDAIKYEIDTARDTPTEASLIKSVLGAGGFIKGAAWVTRIGCPIKFSLDVEQHKDRTAQREHYEVSVGSGSAAQFELLQPRPEAAKSGKER